MSELSGSDIVADIGARLKAAVESVTMADFHHQEAHFDEDSRHGRELLYLVSNDEWVRGTREVVELGAANTLETTIQVHVDLAKITHEAIRDRVGPVWLPLVVLAPPLRDDSALVPSPRVLGPAGTVLPSLPQSEARRWMAAALAEIILQMTPLVAGEAPRRAGREHRLLLSAAIYRVLREGAPDAGPEPPTLSPPDGVRITRVLRARDDLVLQLGGFADRVSRRDGTAVGDRATLLVTRAALIVHAVSSPTTLVVVSVGSGTAPGEFAVRLPSRQLSDNNVSWLRSPRARVTLGLLLPSGEADRSITCRLPEGVSYQATGGSGAVHAQIGVDRPPSWRRLGELLEQICARATPAAVPASQPVADPVLQCLVDLAMTQLDVVVETYRHHSGDPAIAQSGQRVERQPAWVGDLRAGLQRLAAPGPGVPGAGAGGDGSDGALADVERAWTLGRAGGERLNRVLRAEVVNPATAHVRVPAIEDRAIRTTPSLSSAFVQLDVVADRSVSLYTARYAGLMSLVVLGLVLLLLFAFRNSFDDQVLGGVLTLFAVIQASRIEQPDRSTLRGRLVSAGSLLVAASVLPTVLLGVAVAFSRGQEGYVPLWAWIAFGVQAVLVLAMFLGPLSGSAGRWSYGRLQLAGGVELDHRRVDVLHTSWWRTTTAAALLLGRPAYGYVVRQDSHDLAALLGYSETGPRPLARALSGRAATSLTRMIAAVAPDPSTQPAPEPSRSANLKEWASETLSQQIRTIVETPANLLAMLRAGTGERSLTFLVFREQPSKEWKDANRAMPVVLDTERLVAHEADIGHVDVYLGLPNEADPALADHPIRHVLAEAQRGLRTVMDIQLPAPPPPGGRAGRVWSRVRIGLRSREIANLGTFLGEVSNRLRQSGDAGIEMLVDVTSQSPPRRFIGAAPPGGAGAPPVLLPPEELDVVRRIGPQAPGQEWLILGICAYARGGIELEALQRLAEQRPGLRLAGLSTALTHGTNAIFILAHGPAGSVLAGPGKALGKLVFEDAQLLVNEASGAQRLGPAPVAIGGTLIQVRMVTSDRPGLFGLLLDRLGKELAAALGVDSIAPSVLYALTDVADGRLADSRVMVRLAMPRRYESRLQEGQVLDDVERSLRRSMLTPAIAAGPARPGISEWWDARVEVGLNLVYGPGRPEAGIGATGLAGNGGAGRAGNGLIEPTGAPPAGALPDGTPAGGAANLPPA